MKTTYGKEYGAVDLWAILPVLAKSERACEALRNSLGCDRGSIAVEMLRSGKVVGDTGNEIHDFFLDEIVNESKSVWEGKLYNPDDPDWVYSIGINEYEGVFYVWAVDYDTVGYFLSEKAACDYAYMNWDFIREVEK
jgi:hypothetical protein